MGSLSIISNLQTSWDFETWYSLKELIILQLVMQEAIRAEDCVQWTEDEIIAANWKKLLQAFQPSLARWHFHERTHTHRRWEHHINTKIVSTIIFINNNFPSSFQNSTVIDPILTVTLLAAASMNDPLLETTLDFDEYLREASERSLRISKTHVSGSHHEESMKVTSAIFLAFETSELDRESWPCFSYADRRGGWALRWSASEQEITNEMF